MFKEKLRDILVGGSPEGKFKSAVDKYEKAHGVSHEAAEKALFLERFNSVQHDLTYTGTINEGTYRAFVAGLNEIFGKDGVADMKSDSADPMVYRALALAPISPAEFNQVANYFKGKFENKAPNATVVRDCAENKKTIEALHARFVGDPALAGVGDLEALVAAHPELGADLGKILSAKDLSDMHERRFGSGVHFNKSMEKFGTTAKESLTTMFWKAPSDYLKVVTKSGQKLDFSHFAKTTMETAKLIHQEGQAGSRLLLETVKTAKAYLDTKRA